MSWQPDVPAGYELHVCSSTFFAGTEGGSGFSDGSVFFAFPVGKARFKLRKHNYDNPGLISRSLLKAARNWPEGTLVWDQERWKTLEEANDSPSLGPTFVQGIRNLLGL